MNKFRIGEIVTVKTVMFGSDKTALAKIGKVYKNGGVYVVGWGRFDKDGVGLGNMGFSSITSIDCPG